MLVAHFNTLAAPIAQPSLGAPRFDGAHKFAIFSDDPRAANFTLLTAWVPGDDHRGYLQYQITTTVPVAPADQMRSAAPPQGWEEDAYLKRMLSCSFYLQLHGAGGLASEKLPLHFIGDVTWTNEYESLTANEVLQMDMIMYRNFLQAGPSPSWRILWSCK
jgi:hypothetical protein